MKLQFVAVPTGVLLVSDTLFLLRLVRLWQTGADLTSNQRLLFISLLFPVLRGDDQRHLGLRLQRRDLLP